MAKRLLVTSTDLMMVQFLVPHILHLSENGFEIEIACSDVGGRMGEIRQKLDSHVRAIHAIQLVRSPASPTNLKGYRDMKRVIETGHYDIIWTNEPVMGVVTRLAARKARKCGTEVTYMVHGFHFYKGAPKTYWMLFYPIERFAGHFCDRVVTVNREDYTRAQKMGLPDVRYIHGIGINTERLTPSVEQNDIRNELGLPKDTFLLLSVGELNENKNQKTILRAMAVLNDPDIHYLLCGKGDQLKSLQAQTAELGINERVHFLGYRNDVVDICSQSDVFVMPSHREGLPVASLEAMYCGLPLVTSCIRGLVDVLEDGVSGYLCDPDDDAAFAKGIAGLKADPALRARMAERNKTAVLPYCIENTKREVLEILIQGKCNENENQSHYQKQPFYL